MLPISSEAEQLILVDRDDNVVGYESKARAHDGAGLLHRAFSIFLFNDAGEVLLQQRSAQKRLWPLFWSNSCCSHPREGEAVGEAASRRLEQELGVKTPLTLLYKFEYQARYGAAGSEHELCSVFVGRTAARPRVHPDEIAAVKYVTPEALTRALADDPQRYTPWLKLEWERLAREFAREIRP